MGHVRLRDIAEKLGVSVSAVSKALHGSPEIGEDLRLKIVHTAEMLDYHPNNSARVLRLGKSLRLGVILPSFSGVYADILAGIEEYAKPEGYSVVVLNTQNQREMEVSAVSMLVSMPVDAILAVPVSLENYKGILFPIIFLSRFPYRSIPGLVKPRREFSYVVMDDFEGQRIATEHLIRCCGNNVYIALGCKDTSNVWGIKDQIRIAGYKQALTDMGFSFEVDHVFWGAIDTSSGYAVVSRICQTAKPPFGLCVNDDITAIGALHAIRDSGLSVPEDVCLIGYDNLDFCPHLMPPLTTIYSQKQSAGKLAAQYVIKVLRTGETQRLQLIFRPILCVRSSTMDKT